MDTSGTTIFRWRTRGEVPKYYRIKAQKILNILTSIRGDYYKEKRKSLFAPSDKGSVFNQVVKTFRYCRTDTVLALNLRGKCYVYSANHII